MSRTGERCASLIAERWLHVPGEVGAISYRVYRNAKDASQVLVLAELPDHEAAQELARAVGAQRGALPGSSTPDEVEWEATDLDAIN
jgi:hypothetical protein